MGGDELPVAEIIPYELFRGPGVHDDGSLMVDKEKSSKDETASLVDLGAWLRIDVGDPPRYPLPVILTPPGRS